MSRRFTAQVAFLLVLAGIGCQKAGGLNSTAPMPETVTTKSGI